VECEELGFTCGYADRYSTLLGELAYIDYRDKLDHRSMDEEPYATYERLDQFIPDMPMFIVYIGVPMPWIGAIVADESKIDRVIDDLSSLKAPGDGSVFSMVKRCEEVYSGRKLELAPDIVWVPSPDCLPTNHFRGEISSKTSYLTPGAHWGSRRGLLMAIGPDIKAGGVPVASMLDVAPTAYALLSIPIPSDLDGRVLEELMRPESLEDLHIARGPTSIKGERTEMEEDTDESEIRSRLRALGYVE
jgi:hypothetical protein